MSWEYTIKKRDYKVALTETSITLDELKAAIDKALSVINTTHYPDKISVEDANYDYVIWPLIQMLEGLPKLDTGFYDNEDDDF